MAMECKGALVTDWANHKIFCSLSKRADPEVFTYMIDELNEIAMRQGSSEQVRGVSFRSVDKNGSEIYHTDCMFTLLSSHAVICLEAISSDEDRKKIK